MEPEFEVPELSLRAGDVSGPTVRLRPSAAQRMGLSALRQYRVLDHPPAGRVEAALAVPARHAAREPAAEDPVAAARVAATSHAAASSASFVTVRQLRAVPATPSSFPNQAFVIFDRP